METYDILCVGDTALDTFLMLDDSEAQVLKTAKLEEKQLCLDFADKIPVKNLYEALGGNAANVATSCTRLGLKTVIWTVMGEDLVKDNAIRTFREEGLATDFVKIKDDIKSDLSTIIVYKGERTILVYKQPKNYSLPQLPSYKWMYLTSMGIGSENILSELSRDAKQKNAKIVYQPGIYELRIPYQKTQELLSSCEVIIMNREEAIAYTQIQSSELKIQNEGVALPQINTKELLKKLLDLGPKIAVITDGENGAYVSDGETLWTQGVERVKVIEKTGAGDAYAGAFTSAIIKGKDIKEAMDWGHQNAISVISKIGAQDGILTQTTMSENLANNSRTIEIKSEKIN